MSVLGTGVLCTALAACIFAQQEESDDAAAATTDRPPNLVIFFTDDQGYDDLTCYGGEGLHTPRFDRMAREGLRFTSFYAQTVCGPSRAALLTGCYPIRVGEPHNEKNLHTVLHAQELTLAEALKGAGYATAAIGKWHLAGGGTGNIQGEGPFRKELMPRAQGFDRFYGTPMHNGTSLIPMPEQYVVELHSNGNVIESPADMNTLTKRYTEQALDFIEDEKERPFFLYLAHTMPHVPLGCAPEFVGKSERGMYGDVLAELDWSLGQVLDKLAELGLDENTLVIYCSDNGPWIDAYFGDHAGRAGDLRGFKMTTWEGGYRVPAIARWPGHIKPGRTTAGIATTLDIYPTFLALAGAKLPAELAIDGIDLTKFLCGDEEAVSPREEFLFYAHTHLQAVRSGKWKLVMPRMAQPPWTGWYAESIDGVPGFELYDLEADVGESNDLSSQHPEQVARLRLVAEKAREELGDYGRIGKGVRFFDEGTKRPDSAYWPATPPYDKAQPAGSLRFDFEDGDMQGWSVTDGEFADLISTRGWHPMLPEMKYNRSGAGHLSTCALPTGWQVDDEQIGVIESPRILLQGDTISFLVGGGMQTENLVVSLHNAEGEELRRTTGPGSPLMTRTRWNVTEHRGEVVFFRITDAETAVFGHLTLDDVSLAGEIVD